MTPGDRPFEGGEDDVEVVAAHELAAERVQGLLDQFDGDFGQAKAEGDRDAAVAVEVASAGVEPHP